MTTTMADLAVGAKGVVQGYTKTGGSYRQRLMAMGLIRGTGFEIRRIAPMGDPVEILVRGYSLALRRGEAGALLVEAEGEAA
ncbi:MAG: FeoA family protein [bacterium]|nr:FeoA family protein [bacterium]